jgi:hypothetical protein
MVCLPLCTAERGRFAGGSPVALSERSEFSDRPGGPSAARVARRAEAAGRASLPTCLHEQESRSPAGASPGAGVQAEKRPLQSHPITAILQIVSPT